MKNRNLDRTIVMFSKGIQKMQKKQFLSKLNKIDYNNMLEEVLEKKPYAADVKSLLLSMLYKIEISYNDFEKVKRNVMPKNDFIQLIISTIKFCCDQIKIVEPNSEIGIKMGEKIVEVKDKEIIALPTEYALLRGVAELIPQDYIVDSILEDETKKMLKDGFISEVTEVISDFDGWTWNISNISIYTLLYINIKLILGNEFIEQWRYGRKKLKNVKDRIFNLYNGEIQKKFNDEIVKIISKEFVIDFPEKSEGYIKKLKKLRQEYADMDNTIQYITQISNQKKLLNKKIKDIDKLLLDNESLKQKYIEENARRPLEKKIFSVNHYKDLLEKEREKIYNSILQCNKSIEPSNILSKKEFIKNEIKKYEIIENAINDSLSLEELSINFQKLFIKILEIKTERATNKNELINLIYILRYYKNMKVDNYIKDYENIIENLSVLEKNLLLKAINTNLFIKLSNNLLINVDIISRILDTKIIELEEINVILRKKDDVLVLEIFDGEVLDNTIKLERSIETLLLKLNKKAKLFN